MKIDSSGRPYYIDHNTKATTYDDPRAPPPSYEQTRLPPGILFSFFFLKIN